MFIHKSSLSLKRSKIFLFCSSSFSSTHLLLLSSLLYSHTYIETADKPEGLTVWTLDSSSNIGLISFNKLRLAKLDRPCVTASFIPATCQPFKHTCYPSVDIISLYISINHFACNGSTIKSFSGISICLSSWPLSIAWVIWSACQLVYFFFIIRFTDRFGPPRTSSGWKR